MSRLSFTDTPLGGLKTVQRQRLGDTRGFFLRLFCSEELAIAAWRKPIAQINLSYTGIRGTVRGLHFQRPPQAEMKLVSCIRGEVWDVAVDIRIGSPTFLRWHAVRLSAENGCALLIPEGFAHGFQSLTDDVGLIYCHSAPYVPEVESGLGPLDPNLAIPWPLPVNGLSTRDASFPTLASGFEGVVL